MSAFRTPGVVSISSRHLSATATAKGGAHLHRAGRGLRAAGVEVQVGDDDGRRVDEPGVLQQLQVGYVAVLAGEGGSFSSAIGCLPQGFPAMVVEQSGARRVAAAPSRHLGLYGDIRPALRYIW